MKLTPWQSDTLLVTLFVATGLLKRQPAQSLMLVGRPGEGKTSLIRRFAGLPTTMLVSDMTSEGLRRLMTPDSGNAPRTLLMPEFMRLFSRDNAVSSQAANLLTNVMTGDAGTELIGREAYNFSGMQVGVIAAMTSDVFSDRKKEMRHTGLLSRFQQIKLSRSDEERDRVLLNIAMHRMEDLSPIRFPQLRNAVDVQYDAIACGKPLVDLMNSYDELRKDERLTERFKSLACAAALLSDRNRTTRKDIDIIELFVPYFLGAEDVMLDWPVRGWW